MDEPSILDRMITAYRVGYAKKCVTRGKDKFGMIQALHASGLIDHIKELETKLYLLEQVYRITVTEARQASPDRKATPEKGTSPVCELSDEERGRRGQRMREMWARKRAENPNWHPRKAAS